MSTLLWLINLFFGAFLFKFITNIVFNREMGISQYIIKFSFCIFLIFFLKCRKLHKFKLLIGFLVYSIFLFMIGLPLFIWRRSLLFLYVPYSDFSWKPIAFIFYLNFYVILMVLIVLFFMAVGYCIINCKFFIFLKK
jgi:hypothetical protein